MKKRLTAYKSIFREEDESDKSLKAIKDLIELKDVTDEEDQGKMMAMIKGLVFGDNPVADKFLKAINDFTSTLKIEDYK